MASNSDLSDLTLEDLVKVVEGVGKITLTSTRRAPCPLHNGKDKSFSVFMGARGPRWRCHSLCQESGGAVEFVKQHENVSTGEAYKEVRSILGISNDWSGKEYKKKTPPAPISTNAPPVLWSERALAFCRACRDALWAPVGQEALDYLRGRGLSDDLIWDSWLGYNPYSRKASRESWGLEPDGNRQMFAWGHSIVIPWFIGPSIWRVRFRQMGEIEKGERYRQLAGCGNALYLSDTLKPGRLAVMTEGEIDTLSIRQHAPHNVATVATGGVSSARRSMWISKLALCSQVLLAFDDDKAGHQATEWWANVLPNAKRWLLPYGDANDYVRSGGDIAAWLAPVMSTNPPAHQPTNQGELDDELLALVGELAGILDSEEALSLYLKFEQAFIGNDAISAHAALDQLRALHGWAEMRAEREMAEERARNAIYL